MERVASSYLDGLLRGHADLVRGEGGWLDALRAEALERANTLSVPSTRDEEWRFTDLSPLYKASFQRVSSAGALTAKELEPLAVPESGCRLVFVDGHYTPHLSTPHSSRAVNVRRLADAIAERDPLVRAHLAQHVDFRSDSFAAVNTAWLQDGALVLLGRNAVAEAPVHLLFASTRADVVTTPRVLVVAEPGSDCTVLEDYVSRHEGASLTNGVTEIIVGAGARIRHVRLQRESLSAFHVASCKARLERDARYLATAVAFGARISRYNLSVVQADEGAECEIDGLALIAGRQLADTHSLLDHTRANGRSRQLHKCIVAGAGHAVFNGKIVVRPGAQHTDSSQQSRSLLLTDRAHVDAKPQLEIFADDVKCAHGAAVGQLDAEQVFYLKSRGLSDGAARDLLTFAFAAAVVERIPVPSLVRRLEEIVLRQTQTRNSR